MGSTKSFGRWTEQAQAELVQAGLAQVGWAAQEQDLAEREPGWAEQGQGLAGPEQEMEEAVRAWELRGLGWCKASG